MIRMLNFVLNAEQNCLRQPPMNLLHSLNRYHLQFKLILNKTCIVQNVEHHYNLKRLRFAQNVE